MSPFQTESCTEDPVAEGDLRYSIVIPTLGRPAQLRETLAGIAAQSRLPEFVIVVDATGNEVTKDILFSFSDRFSVSYQQATEPSAAMQRNQGALRVTTPIVGFVDDDITLYPDACDRICSVFDHDFDGKIGGVSGRGDMLSRPVPKGLIWWYYRIQAGYAHPTYGGKLFGAAINCCPSYVDVEAENVLISADWLASTCVFFRTSLFHEEMFPNFEGYSYLEDVHLSARIGKRSRLYFHTAAKFHVRDVAGFSKKDVREIARLRIRNRRLVSREIVGLSGLELEAKFFLHRLFESVAILRRHDSDWKEELYGTWL
jgi:glycosyltransferase involved in cell wall biosynthesis